MGQKNKIIIFGGAGFIGTHFRDYFSGEKGYSLRSYDVQPEAGSEFVDVRQKIEIPGEFSPNDIIINLAAVHRTPGHLDSEYFETNIRGAENVCEFAVRVGIKNIIFTSSIAPYGASEELKEETTLPTPNTPYGISKLVAEHIHKEWAAGDPERKLMILRPGVVFGKGEKGNYTRLYQAINRGIFFYPGRKDTVKACIYVKELVKQSWYLFSNQTDQVQLYNVAYYPSPTIEEIANTIAEVTNNKKPSLVVSGNMLKTVAKAFQLAGLGKLGIHPDRVKKLMTSTNISGKKLKEAIPGYHYSLKEAIEDWYMDCNKQGLF